MMRNPFKRATPAFEARPAGREPAAPAPDLITEATEEIDREYDAQLYDGMPMAEALRIERARDATHRNLMTKVLGMASQGRTKL